jgi:hypothetical protein
VTSTSASGSVITSTRAMTGSVGSTAHVMGYERLEHLDPTSASDFCDRVLR